MKRRYAGRRFTGGAQPHGKKEEIMQDHSTRVRGGRGRRRWLSLLTTVMVMALAMSLTPTVAVGQHSLDSSNGVAEAPTQPRNVVRFAGLTHLSLGEATLALDDGSLLIEGIGDSGADGAAVRLPAARTWSADLDMRDREGGFLRLTAVTQGRDISSLDFRAQQDGLGVTPTFEASRYTVEILRDGEPQARITGIPSGEPVSGWILIPVSWCRLVPEFWDCGFVFRQAPSGACQWSLTSRLGRLGQFHLADGTIVLGDEVRVTESYGGAPYRFTEMRLEAARFDSIRIVEEQFERLTEGAEPR